MDDTPATPVKKCERCNAPPLKKPDPDGGRRCFAHSTAPETVAKRQACAAQGAATAAKVRGIPNDERGAVLAGVVDIDAARAKAFAGKRAKKREDEVGEAKPIPMRTREDVLSLMERSAGRLFGGADPKEAQAAAAIARTALAALGLELPEGDDEDGPQSFAYETTEGRAVNVRGRESPGGN